MARAGQPGALMIYGISQTSGVERLLQCDRVGAGVLLTITDRVGGVERERIMVQAADLLSTVMDRPVGGVTIEGETPAHGKKHLLDIEVRRNEVLLRVRAPSGDGCDVAVGLDDFQDTLERVVS
jgi:hypothetical protein